MSRTNVPAWLAIVVSVGACLGLAVTVHAQPGVPGGAGQPPVGPPPVGPPPVGGVVGGVGVGVGGVAAGVDVYQGVAVRSPYDYAQPNVVYRPLDKWYYYPYYYFPHNFWPAMGPKWPE